MEGLERVCVRGGSYDGREGGVIEMCRGRVDVWRGREEMWRGRVEVWSSEGGGGVVVCPSSQ